MPYNFVERLSRPRVSLEPSPSTNDELREVPGPMTEGELGFDYPRNPYININNLPPPHQDKQENVSLLRSERLRQLKNKNINYHNVMD